MCQNIRENCPCTCEECRFKDEFHRHVVTGGLRIATKKRLRKMIVKEPKSRESKRLNRNFWFKSIENSLTDFVDVASKKCVISKKVFFE